MDRFLHSLLEGASNRAGIWAAAEMEAHYIFDQNRPEASENAKMERSEETQRRSTAMTRQLRPPMKQHWRKYFLLAKACHQFKKPIIQESRNGNDKGGDDSAGSSGLSRDAIRRKWRKPLVVLKVCRQFESTLQKKDRLLEMREEEVRKREAQLAQFPHLSLDETDFRPQYPDSIALEQAFPPEPTNVATTTGIAIWEVEREKLSQKSPGNPFEALGAKLRAKINAQAASTCEQLAARRGVVKNELAENQKQVENLKKKVEDSRTALDDISKLLGCILDMTPRVSSMGVDESNELVRGKLLESIANVKRKAEAAATKLGTQRGKSSKDTKFNRFALAEQRLFQDFASIVSAEMNTVWDSMSSDFISMERIQSWFLEFLSSRPDIEEQQSVPMTSVPGITISGISISDIPISDMAISDMAISDIPIPYVPITDTLDNIQSQPDLDIVDWLLSDDYQLQP